MCPLICTLQLKYILLTIGVIALTIKGIHIAVTVDRLFAKPMISPAYLKQIQQFIDRKSLPTSLKATVAASEKGLLVSVTAGVGDLRKAYWCQ